ncbi:MAG TPA: HAMP domain-containing sensor histidine kinase, partial [Oscillatoriaceae cyanobacterium]
HVRIVRADGSVRFSRSRSESVFQDGQLVRIFGVLQDVTELKQALEEVAQRTAELERAQQLNALKNNFVNSVSHELRTPLTSILGYAEFLEDEVAGPITEGQREFVHEIVSGARRLEHLVDDLLDFARIDAGTFKLRPIESNFVAKIREIVASLAPQAIAGRLQLEVDAPETLMVRMDPQRVGQVLLNLLTNAVKFTAAGGNIHVSARVEGDRLLCEVQDTGEGIAPEQLDKLFLRFSQLPSGARRGGAGLGLSISKTLVEMHGGTIGVRSALGHGSTFGFTLPIGGPA